MWGNKKSHTPQSANPEPRILQTNQPPKPGSAPWEGTTKMNKDAMRPAEATADRRDSAARIEPACERRNLGQRGPVH